MTLPIMHTIYNSFMKPNLFIVLWFKKRIRYHSNSSRDCFYATGYRSLKQRLEPNQENPVLELVIILKLNYRNLRLYLF